MAEFRFDINARDNSSAQIDRLTSRINQLKADLASIGANSQWRAALQKNLLDTEADLVKLQQSARAAAGAVGSSLRGIAQDSGFLSRRMQQDMASAVGAINNLNVSAVQGMMNASKEGQTLVERQAQRNRAIAVSNQFEIERITGRPMILGGAANMQPITATNSMFATLGSSIDDVEHKSHRLAKTWGLNRIGMLEMEAAGVNTFQALASGMDPFHVAIMESAQVMGALVQGGLIPSTSIVSALASPITGLVVAVGALTAAFTYLGYQYTRSVQNAAEVRAGLILVGAGAEMSAAQVTAWETHLRESFGLARSEAHEVATSFADLIPTLGKSAVELGNLAAQAAKLPGAKFDEVLKKWQAAAKGGVEGINKLSEELKANQERTRQHYGEQAKAGEVSKTLAEQTRDLKAAVEEQGGVLVRNQALWDHMRESMGLVGGAAAWLAGKLADVGQFVVGGPTQIPSVGNITNPGASGRQLSPAQDFLTGVSKNNADLANLNSEFRRRLNEWLGTLSEAERSTLRIGPRGAFATSGHAPDSSHYKGVAIDIAGMSASAAAKLKAAKLAENVKHTTHAHIEPEEIPSATSATAATRANMARQFAATQTAASPIARETVDQIAITRSAEQNLKTQNEINTLLKQRENLIKSIGETNDESQQQERQAAADNIEQQLRSMHTPTQQTAHKLRMAQLEQEVQAAEIAARKDITQKEKITETARKIQEETTNYMQGATLGRAEFSRKETSESIAAAHRTEMARRGSSEAVTAAELRGIDLRRAAISNDAAAQLPLARQKLDATIKAETSTVEQIDSARQEIVRLEAQANQQSFQDFMKAKQNEVREAKGSADKINVIIEEMRQKAASTYNAQSRDYKRAMEDIERIQIEATERSVQARITDASRAAQIDQIQINQAKRRLDAAVVNRTMTQQAALQEESSIIQQKTQIEIEALQQIIDANKGNTEQVKRLDFEILQSKERLAQRIEDINKRIAEANERDLKKSMESYKQFFSSIGSGLESYLEAAILKTQTFADANRQLLRSVGKAALGLVGDVASKSLAGQLGGKAGEGASDVISRLLVTSLGLNSAVTTANTAASTAQAVSTTANTTTQGVALVSNTVSTGINSAAVATNTAAVGASSTGSMIGGIMKMIPFIGGFFAHGGIVPSAAGGMVVGGGGATIGILHPREMVLPANLSQGIQGMIERGGSSNGSAAGPTLNYNANVTGYHPYSSKSAFEGLLRQHGNTLMAHVENAARNGWRR